VKTMRGLWREVPFLLILHKESLRRMDKGSSAGRYSGFFELFFVNFY